MDLKVAAATHVGLRRKTNADAFLLNDAAGIYTVADGMGDTPRSGIVAKAALEAVHELFVPTRASLPSEARNPLQAAERLFLGMMQANARLYAPGRAKEQRVGTTFAGVVVCGANLCIGHAGDSRVALLRRGERRLARLTEDDTVISDALWRGEPYDVAALRPNPDALTCALGVWPSIKVAPIIERWEPGDVVALYTDGISDRVEPQVIADALLEYKDLGEAAQRLIDRANGAGGGDNATLVLVRWADDRNVLTASPCPSATLVIATPEKVSHVS